MKCIDRLIGKEYTEEFKTFIRTEQGKSKSMPSA